MSSVTNTIQTNFTARGGQLLAFMGQATSSTRSWSNSLGETSRMSDRINNQWRAIGTTIRYALAGQAVFGLTRMAGQLKDVQVQLGLIQAIGSQRGGSVGGLGTPFTTRQVTEMGIALQGAAADSMTSIADMNAAAINFLSTVQDVKRTDIPGILQNIARGATLTQTPIEDLTQLVTTMNIAFGRKNTPNAIAQNVASWFELIRLAPGGIKSAPELVKAIPTVSTVFQQGLSRSVPPNVAQAQMQALILGSLRFGATPSTAMRGLAFFLQSLETPATPRAAKDLASIGITPQTVRRRGIYAETNKFLRHVRGDLTTDQLRAIQNIPEENLREGMNLPGVAPGQMTFLRSSLGRIHAIRAAIVLASQLERRGDVASLADDLRVILNEREKVATGTTDMARAWQDFSKRAQLQDMANRVNIMLFQMAQSFEGILNFMATKMVAPITNFAQAHREGTRNATIGVAGAGAIYAASRILRGARGLPLGRAAAGVQGVRSIAGLEADGTLAKPFFVIVTNQIYKPFGGATPTGGGVPPPGSEAGRRGRIGGAARRLAGGAAIFSLADLGNELTGRKLGGGRSLFDPKFYTQNTGLINTLSGGRFQNWLSPSANAKNDQRITDLQRAQTAFTAQGGRGQVSAITDRDVEFRNNAAGLVLNVNVRHPDGTVSKAKIHVPYGAWQNNKFPSRQGKVKGNR